VLGSLRKAVEAMPDDVPLRVHLATMLMSSGLRDEAVRQAGAVLQRDPGNNIALALLQGLGQRPVPGRGAGLPEGIEYDWSRAESEVQGLPPSVLGSDGVYDGPAAAAGGDPDARAFDAERAELKLADVAGMAEVKRRLEAAFLAPLRNPELRRLYSKSLRGGLLLYGPPGCGKTFIARAVLPPDQPARAAVFQYHLRERPVAGADVSRLAQLTEGYSGADIAHVCETSAEHALMDSVEQGTSRPIGQADLEAAIAEVRPSFGPWLETARNVALFANEGGTYDDLAAYLRKRRML
jgi:hypothetical protein